MNQHIEGPDLSAFLDGALPGEDRLSVDAHLSSCAECRMELESLRHLKLALSSAPRKAMPADLALDLERRIVHGRAWRPDFPAPTFWIPAGALAAALLAGVWIRSAVAPEELPLEPLLAAHSRYSAESLISEDNLVSSNYSDLTSRDEDASDVELE